jgi:hypothetical protein
MKSHITFVKSLSVVVFTSLVLYSTTVRGADFSTYVDETGDPTTLISGTINPGDFDRFAVYMNNKPEALLYFFAKGVYLESSGGDVREALRFAWFIENSLANTIIEAKSSCASSCFIIFSSGARRILKGGLGSNSGRIGVHRISLVSNDLDIKRNDSLVKPASDNVESYLKRVGIPRKLIDKMNETSPSSIFWADFDWLYKEDLLQSLQFRPSFLDVSEKKCGLDPLEKARSTKIFPTDLREQRLKWISCVEDVRFVNQKPMIKKMSSILLQVASKYN